MFRLYYCYFLETLWKRKGKRLVFVYPCTSQQLFHSGSNTMGRRIVRFPTICCVYPIVLERCSLAFVVCRDDATETSVFFSNATCCALENREMDFTGTILLSIPPSIRICWLPFDHRIPSLGKALLSSADPVSLWFPSLWQETGVSRSAGCLVSQAAAFSVTICCSMVGEGLGDNDNDSR